MSSGAPGDDFRFLPPEHMWKLARVVIQTWFKPMMRLRVYGGDRVPEGAAVIASNHIAGDDPIVLGMSSHRSIRYMAKIELWRIPVLRAVIPHTGAFPVDRGNADRTTIMQARSGCGTGNCSGSSSRALARRPTRSARLAPAPRCAPCWSRRGSSPRA